MLSYPFDEFGKPLAQVLRETPQPTGSEVVVRVGSCGLCHSDVHLHEGYFDLGNGQKLDLSRGIAPPRVLGHEIAGTVVGVGPDAGGVAVGDRRVVFPWIGCTACGPCTAGSRGAVHGAARPRHQPRWRLRRPCAGAASALSVRLRPAARGARPAPTPARA